jgi:uncharacterized protein YfiM (DUF2279 family)
VNGILLLLAFLAQDSWWGTDKAYHLTVSHFMANALAMHTGWSPVQVALFTLGVGIGKELVDATFRGTGFSLKDLFWDAVGTAAALYPPPPSTPASPAGEMRPAPAFPHFPLDRSPPATPGR